MATNFSDGIATKPVCHRIKSRRVMPDQKKIFKEMWLDTDSIGMETFFFFDSQFYFFEFHLLVLTITPMKQKPT